MEVDRTVKKFLVLVLLSVLLLSACAPKETFQREWPTPAATFTPESGVSGPPTPTRLFECIAWKSAPNYLGRSQCVEGPVLRVDKSEEANLVVMSNEPGSFYGVSFGLDLSDLAGKKCVRVVGTIETYKDRPAIIIESRDQILPCLGKE